MDLDVSRLQNSGSGIACSELYAERVSSGTWFALVLDSYLKAGGCAVRSSCPLDRYRVAVEEGAGDECCSEV